MKPAVRIALFAACFFAAGSWLCAQSQQNGNTAPASPDQKKQTGNAQQPAKPPTDDNPFPGDETNVPVLPSKDTPDIPAGNGDANGDHAALPAGDVDPVASPDDGAPQGDSQPASGFSSSSSGVDGLLGSPDGEPQGKHGKQGQVVEPEHHETAAEDENVGKYYLDNKDWHAAMSRFQSAMVLDPENPDVYWGLAESERHLGNYADARANYQKVMEYDPDSKHAKEAAKALKEPELANAKPTAASKPQ
jgi:tetratricopeptide (TPR) repeat protein